MFFLCDLVCTENTVVSSFLYCRCFVRHDPCMLATACSEQWRLSRLRVALVSTNKSFNKLFYSYLNMCLDCQQFIITGQRLFWSLFQDF